MYKLGICGHFGNGKNLLNGQTVKTKVVTDELKDLIGKEKIITVDSYDWQRKPISLIISCFRLIKQCNNIIILPAIRGVKVFVPLFQAFNRIYHRNLHYIVIGGWLPEMLEKNTKLKEQIKKFTGVYVETHTMVKKLKSLGLDNVYYLPNFKKLNVISEDELIYPNKEPFKLCTFSRVMKEKGIEEAIEAVKRANTYLKRVVFNLDIYGQIEKGYEERFEQLRLDFPNYISYKGVVPFNESINTLKGYYALLFPTYYEGEGFPGTIIDSFSAGLPVVATDWKYNSEIITHNVNGIIYNNEVDELVQILIDLSNEPGRILLMKKNCITEANKYNAKIVMENFINKLKL